MKICVTGGLGFIGLELIKFLNKSFDCEILIIDDASKLDFNSEGYFWFQDYKGMVEHNNYDILKEVDFIFHLGANSSTRAYANEIFDSNYLFSIKLIQTAYDNNIPVVFASSASIYGARRSGNELNPQTPYAYFKAEVERAISHELNLNIPLGKVISLRFHNVYGATESHKGGMASIVSKWIDSDLKGIKTNALFHDSYNIFRDFVHIDDVVNSLITMLRYYINNGKLPLYHTLDIGTGNAVSFQDVAYEIIDNTKGTVQYIINPYTEKDYQFFTQADITDFKKIYQSLYGYEFTPISVKDGVKMVYDEKRHINSSRSCNTDNSTMAGL